MNTYLLSFLEALFQELRDDPTDPEPLFLTKRIAFREFFNSDMTIKRFCELFNVQFDYFTLPGHNNFPHTVYYSFRMLPETTKPKYDFFSV